MHRHGLSRQAERLGDGVHGQLGGLRDLVVGRLATQARLQRPPRALDGAKPVGDVHGQADGAAAVRDRPLHGLADPPRRVRGELEVAAPVELLDRPVQSQHALLDQVEERHALAAVLLGDRDHQAQVRLDHAALGDHVAALDRLGQLHLFVLGQQRIATGLTQEQVEAVGGRDLDVDDLHTLLRSGRVDHLDAEPGEFVAQRLYVVGIEVEFLGQTGQFVLVEHPSLLAELDQEPGFRLDDQLVSHRYQLPRKCSSSGSPANPGRFSLTFAPRGIFPLPSRLCLYAVPVKVGLKITARPSSG